jgi:zinc protease
VTVILPLPKPGSPPEPTVPVPYRFTLPSGLRVVAVPWGELPQVVLKLVLPVGSMAESREKAGAANLLGRMLTEGTVSLDAQALNARLDRIGAALDVQVSHEFTEIELFLLSEALPAGIPLLAEIVTRPTMPAREFERVRDETIDALIARADEPANVADDRTAEAVFGADHPYGRTALGTTAGLAEVRREDLQLIHHRFYRPEGAFVVAAGQLDVERLADLLTAAFADWQGAPEPVISPAPRAIAAAAGQTIRVAWPDAYQAELRVGALGLPRSSPDWIPAAVANYILGGSTITGRLGANLREQKGWTYGARSAFSAARQAAGWVAETAVEKAVTEAASAELLQEVRRLREEPVADDELQRAHDAIVLSLPRAFETPARVASRFMTLTAFDLPQDYWERLPAAVRTVTTEEVRRVAEKYFAEEGLVRVVVG